MRKLFCVMLFFILTAAWWAPMGVWMADSIASQKALDKTIWTQILTQPTGESYIDGSDNKFEQVSYEYNGTKHKQYVGVYTIAQGKTQLELWLDKRTGQVKEDGFSPDTGAGVAGMVMIVGGVFLTIAFLFGAISLYQDWDNIFDGRRYRRKLDKLKAKQMAEIELKAHYQAAYDLAVKELKKL